MLDRLCVGAFIEEILVNAACARASDIHFELVGEFLKIRCRKDGVFSELSQVPCSIAGNIYSHLKSLARLNTTEKNRPQDGRITIDHSGVSYHFRLATTPTHASESLVLRVLYGADSWDLYQLGIPKLISDTLLTIANKKHGILVVAGPTGSGKTTTLYGLLREILTNTKKFLTVEDPVECIISGTTQVSIQESIGLTFPRVLRSFLRQDPDIIMIGEIRDAETAKIAIQASLTGHLVLCTLHTEGAVSVVARLIDLGLEGPQIANTLLAVLSQRLVRTLDGRGRKAIFECLAVSQEMRGLICNNESRSKLLAQAIIDGMVPVREEGLKLVKEGVICSTDLDQVLGYVN